LASASGVGAASGVVAASDAAASAAGGVGVGGTLEPEPDELELDEPHAPRISAEKVTREAMLMSTSNALGATRVYV
jgi:hypothetical protein